MTTALWCVLLAGILPVLTVAVAKWGPGLDNANPRDWATRLDGYRKRAYAAHQNSFEAFPFFAAAVFAAKWGQAPQATVDALAILFVAARLAYVAAYVGDRPTFRSIVWIVGWVATLAIFSAPAWAR
jgi:uncharacterized MAPEG superfamily protein